jgi:acetylornithine deacetylase
METPASSPIVRVCEALTGQTAGAVAFGTEGPYFNAMGTDTVILGPGDIDQAHQPDEFLTQSRIKPTLEILDRLIRRFCLSSPAA